MRASAFHRQRVPGTRPRRTITAWHRPRSSQQPPAGSQAHCPDLAASLVTFEYSKMRKDILGLARRITSNEPAKRRSPSPVISTGRHRLGGAHRARSAKLPPRFPITRQGHDRAVVDERFAELEQEVSELEQELIELDRELVNVQASTPPKATRPARLPGPGSRSRQS